MARVFSAKKSSVGKEIKCKKCGTKIKPGEKYYYYTRRFSRSKRAKGVRFTHCSAHYPRPTDLSSSPVAEITEAIQDAQKEIDSATCGADLMAAVETLKGVAEDVKQRSEDSLENMPEHLRESSDSGQQLQERIDALESFVEELENISIDDSLQEQDEPEEDASDEEKQAAEDANKEWENAKQEIESAIDSFSL